MMRMSVVLFGVCLWIASFSGASAQGTETLMSIKSGKVVFEVRAGNPKNLARHLRLIHETFEDLAQAGKHPEFRVTFAGPAVKAISTNREGFAAEDMKELDGIADAVGVLAKDGIVLDVCLVAARVLNVDPESVLSEIHRTKNGWFSLISYQSQGYAFIPVY